MSRRGTNKVRKAVKQYECTECRRVIAKGELYLCQKAPPEADFNDSGRWLVIRACKRCALLYGLVDKETRKQLETV